MEPQKICTTESHFEKKINKIEGATIPEFKVHKATVITTVWH